MKIKVISLNIWHGELLSKVIDFLVMQDADIVMLQEVYNGEDTDIDERYRSFSNISAALSKYGSDFAQSYLQSHHGKLTPHGNAVFTKFTILKSTATYLVDPSFDKYENKPEHWPILPHKLQGLKLSKANSTVNVFNMQGIWDLDGDSLSPQRKEMFNRVVKATKDYENVILAGDTNAKQTNSGFETIKQYLKPVFDESLITTFNMKHKDNPGYATAAVDLMYVSPNIEIVSKSVPDVDVSDHLPLVVELRIN